MSALDKSSPAEIVGKVMCGDAVETAHPFLESAIVGIDVLNMVNPGNNTNTSGQVNRTMSDADFPCGGSQSLAAIRAENGILRQNGLEGCTDVLLVGLDQHEVGCATGPIPADQHGNLFVRQTALRCLTAPLAGCTRHPALLAFERFEEKGFIRFGNACKTHGLLLVGQGEKPMAPAEGRVPMHFASFRALAYALSFRHLPCVFQPLVFVAQPGEWRARKGIERGFASATTIALQSRGRPPARDMLMTATGASWLRHRSAFHQGIYRLDMPNFTQLIRQNISLMWRQLLKIARQYLENGYALYSPRYYILWAFLGVPPTMARYGTGALVTAYCINR